MDHNDMAAAVFGLPQRWWFFVDDSIDRCLDALHDAHPDNGGTEERLVLLSDAWAILEPYLRQRSRNSRLHTDYFWAWNKVDKEASLVVGIPWPCDRKTAATIYNRRIEDTHPDMHPCLKAAWDSICRFYDVESVVLEECPDYAYSGKG